MARPRRCRKICTEPAYDSFKPEGISVGEEITMTVDEYEVIRLVDLENIHMNSVQSEWESQGQQ